MMRLSDPIDLSRSVLWDLIDLGTWMCNAHNTRVYSCELRCSGDVVIVLKHGEGAQAHMVMRVVIVPIDESVKLP